MAWAAVGPVPEIAGLSTTARLALSEVPLDGMPPWLGIDRALASWWAWRRWPGPLLVVDAGTVLSLNRMAPSGRFNGGRLLAGLALQWQAMAAGTAALPDTLVVPGRGFGALSRGGQQPWPMETQEAMLVGVSQGLAAAIVAATLECGQGGLRLVLTGGDAPILKPLIAPSLARWGIPLEHEPNLCLAALAALRPPPDQGAG
ncbi:MAG: type III pantothenate kinase [Cyanobacteria bacterium]|nr:type III pantothenate kinase [Cyanobacteriota bacterium]